MSSRLAIQDMTPERAREILEFGNAAAEYRPHMTLDEIELLDDIWTRMERSSSYEEILRLLRPASLNKPTIPKTAS